MKILNWKVVQGFVLLLLSVAFYFLHYGLLIRQWVACMQYTHKHFPAENPQQNGR